MCDVDVKVGCVIISDPPTVMPIHVPSLVWDQSCVWLGNDCLSVVVIPRRVQSWWNQCDVREQLQEQELSPQLRPLLLSVSAARCCIPSGGQDGTRLCRHGQGMPHRTVLSLVHYVCALLVFWILMKTGKHCRNICDPSEALLWPSHRPVVVW